ncbi:MAG: hypothetical protein ACLQVM_26865 [Terriglobia bacterium]
MLRLDTDVPSCAFGEFHINADNLDGKLGDLLRLGSGRFFPAWTASRVSVMISRMGTAVVGTSGRREAVLLDMNQYRRMLRKLEDLEHALALDCAERTSKRLVPYEDVRRRLKQAGKVTRDQSCLPGTREGVGNRNPLIAGRREWSTPRQPR